MRTYCNVSEKLLSVVWEGLSEEVTTRCELNGKDLVYKDLSGSQAQE